MSGFYYLATPYSKHPRGHDAAFGEAITAAAICIRAGIMVVSPIAHSHPIAVNGGIEGHYEAWRDLDEALIDASRGIIVVEMDGWQQSEGIAFEVELAKSIGLPVFYMKPEGPPPEIDGGQG